MDFMLFILFYFFGNYFFGECSITLTLVKRILTLPEKINYVEQSESTCKCFLQWFRQEMMNLLVKTETIFAKELRETPAKKASQDQHSK